MLSLGRSLKRKFRPHWQEGGGESRHGGPDMHLIGAYLRLEGERKTLHALSSGYYSAEYKNNPQLDRVYKYLCELGYRMSDEEARLMDGTHEYYSKSEEDD